MSVRPSMYTDCAQDICVGMYYINDRYQAKALQLELVTI